MFSPKSRNVSARRVSGRSGERSVAGFPRRKEQVVQAMLLPARMKRDSFAYITEFGVKKMVSYLPLHSGELILIEEPDDAGPSNDSQNDSGEFAEEWTQCHLMGTMEECWVRSELLDKETPSDSFKDLVELVDKNWAREGDTWPWKERGWNVLDSFFAMAVYPKDEKPKLGEADEASTVKAMTRVMRDKMPGTYAYLEKEGADTIYFGSEKLANLHETREYRRNMIRISAWRKKSGAVMPPSGTSLDMSEMLPGRRPTLEAPASPQSYNFVLNVQAFAMPQVLDVLAKLISPESEMETSYIDTINIVPVNRAHRRTDTFTVDVVSKEGFDRTAKALVAVAEAHPEYFGTDVMRMTEPLAPGVGWSEGTSFFQVWEMDEDMLASVYRFYGRVAKMIERKRGWRRHFERPDYGQIRKLQELETTLDNGLKRKNNLTPDGEKVDKDNLRLMNKLYRELVGEEGSLSLHVLEWIEHYEAYQEKRGRESRTFMSKRASALATMLEKRPMTMDEAIRMTRKEFGERDLDFFHPHRNMEVKPYCDDDMVLLENLTPGLKGEEAQYSYKVVPGAPRAKLKADIGRGEELKTGGEPTYDRGAELRLPTDKKTDDNPRGAEGPDVFWPM
ncbi:hypothetical protein FUAX_39540 (plasmid) [Fulvitalea axinellae]|uniref:Uncharacterized protein n=1 Tax=Fulvitalea axinellae TaxID=1182444 RepID=A0AAU9CWV8_9BACT|nr:hypothetical protein FUAX_39540 [Fulvitalea axinellae]